MPATPTRWPPRFAGTLQFGTAGLRGALGGGPNRMNLAVVRAATLGLARFLVDHGRADRGVVVGYDHRHGSERFARDAAGVLAAAGIPVRLADRAWPTPVTAYAVRHFAAAAGVMVTASHNPAPDNGYKVYDDTGSQIIPPTDVEIAAHIASAGSANAIPSEPGSARIATIGDDALDAYLDVAAGSRTRHRASCASSTRRCTASASTCSSRCGSAPVSHRRSSSTRKRNPIPTSPPRRSRIPRNRACSTWPSTSRPVTTPTSSSRTTPTPTGSQSRCRTAEGGRS